MKLKIAVVLGPKGAGKSWTLKSFSEEIVGKQKLTDTSVRPVVYEKGESLDQYGFKLTKQPDFGQEDWGVNWNLSAGEVTIADWGTLVKSAKDILVTGVFKGRKILVASEGDYPWSWLLNILYLQSVFGSLSDNDEALVFCACRWDKYARARGLELEEFPPKGQPLGDGALRIIPLEWKKGETTTKVDEEKVKDAKDKLKEIFDKWTGLEETSGQGSGKDA